MASIRFRIAPHIGALAVAALLLLTGALGRAAAETPDTITTQLKPGINFVGWVGPETPVADLFDDVPEIEAVYTWAWDGSRRTWLSASPRVPAERHTLETLTTGTGLVLRVGGAEGVEWVRPLIPGSGFVWLVRGLNLTPWVGDAGNTLQGARLDARPWFLAAHAWDPASNQYRTYDPQTPATIDALSQVNIGDALWIEVGEGSDGYWDQRSDSLSQIRGTLTGPEGEPFVDFGVTAIALDSNDNWFYDFTNSDGSFSILVRTGVPYILRFHHDGKPGCWLFYKDGLAVRDDQTASPLRAYPTDPASVTFQMLEGACGWEIRGRATRANGDAITEAAATAWLVGMGTGDGTSTEADGSFTIRVRRDGLYALAVRLDEGCRLYYRDGDIVMSEDAASQIAIGDRHIDDVEFVVPDGICEHQIHGTAVDHNNVPLSGSQVRAHSTTGVESYSTIREDGSFSVTVPDNGSYRLSVWLDGECRVYHHADGTVSSFETASLIRVANRDVTGVRIVAAPQRCGWVIRGVMLHDDGTPLAAAANSSVLAITVDNVGWSGAIDDNGAFEVEVPADGSYRLQMRLDDECRILYRSDEATIEHDLAELVEVSGGNVTGLRLTVPDGICGWLISGTVVDSEHRNLPGIEIIAEGPRGTQWDAVSGVDGSFSVYAQISGSYELRAEPQAGCMIPLGTVEVTESGSEDADKRPAGARTIRFDVEMPGDVEIPANACERRIQGRLIDADGQGVADKWLWATTSELERGGASSEPDGSFVITVPVTGVYTLGFWATHDCYAYYNESADASPNHASHVTVGDADVTGITIRIPDNPCG